SGPTQRGSQKRKLPVRTIAGLRVPQLNLPVRASIRRVKNHAAMQFIFPAGDPAFIGTNEMDRHQHQIFFDVHRLPDCFEFWSIRICLWGLSSCLWRTSVRSAYLRLYLKSTEAQKEKKNQFLHCSS